jgi:hypothetical protein
MERILALLVLSLVSPAVVHAAEAGDCRNLLTVDEVASAVGGDAKLTSAGKRGEVDTGSGESQRLQVCTWAADSWRGGVNVDVVPALGPSRLARGLEVVAFPLEELREQHWREERLDFGGVRCSSLSPPTPATAEPQVTGCVGEVNGAALYVGISSRNGRPTFDLAKQLFDEAAARL